MHTVIEKQRHFRRFGVDNVFLMLNIKQESYNRTSFMLLVHYQVFLVHYEATNIGISVVMVLFLVVGTAGSLITAIVIGKTKSCHTKANIFIFSLCVSDLISGLICSPLWLYRRTWGFEYWNWPEFMCKCISIECIAVMKVEKCSLCSRNYAKASNERRCSFPRLSA